MRVETGITKNQIVSALAKSPHGKLIEYAAIGQQAAAQEPEFFAHLIAWNQSNGEIRDSKVALPIVSLSVPAFSDPEFVDNSLAHIAKQGPRELARAFRFAKEIKVPGRMLSIRRVIESYLRGLEDRWPKWERTAVQHRGTLRELYALCHVKPCSQAADVLFAKRYAEGSVFTVIAGLKAMAPVEAAGAILENDIPFLVAMGALGAKAKEPDLVMALIERMSATELVNNSKMLEKLGVKTNPALRGAYQAAIDKAAGSKRKGSLLKATKAVEAVDDEGTKEKLRGLQDKQIAANKGIEGNWLVLGDKSGSMDKAIEAARHVAATLAKMVKGNVYLVFFDNSPRFINATGKTYDALLSETGRIAANGGTSIGCGLQYAIDAKLDIDGIAVISDGGENATPWFQECYKRYGQLFDKEPTVYLYHTNGESNVFVPHCKAAGIDVQEFGIEGMVDYYSIPNLCATMRVGRYALVDEIMATPLLKLENVLKPTRRERAVCM